MLLLVFSRIIPFEEQNTMSLSPIPPRRIVTCSCLSDGNFFCFFSGIFSCLLGIRVSESWFEARGDKTQPKTRLICKCLVVAE